MIILDEREYLTKELEAKGFEVFNFFENHQVLSMKEFNSLELKRRSEFVLVDTETVLRHPEIQENFKSLLNTFIGAVFLHEHSNTKAQEWVKNEGAFLTKIIGEYSLPMPQLNWTILSNQLQFFWDLLEDQKKLQKNLAQFSVDLDQVLQNAELEMIKAKKLHETLVPRRTTEVKGIHFINKYAAGDGGGGEFYDLHQTPTKVYQILVSSQSYLISSAILGLLGEHKKQNFKVSDFIKDAEAEIATINEAKKKKAEVDLLILELDLNTLILTKPTKSKAEIYSQVKGKINLEKGHEYQLEKNEKLAVLSPGLIFNWNDTHPDKDIQSFLKENANTSSTDLMSELFIKLKEDEKGQFLKKDATVVMLEVTRHGIHKV